MSPTQAGGVELDVRLDRGSFSLDVALTVAPGEVLAVLGPNGAGKSTLLGLLSGTLRPDAGRVVVAGRTVTDVEGGVFVPAHQRGVGLLAQQALLFPHLTALANVAFGPRAHGVPRRTADARARGLLADVLPDVPGLADRKPSQLSGGQQQRVALARAIAPDPRLLLLDEPLAALDVDAAPAMRSLLRRVIRDSEQTAVLVTHSALDAFVLADQVVVLGGGRIVEIGPTREVLGRPRSAFTARIAGLDLVPGVRAGAGLRTADGTEIAGRDAERVHAAEEIVAEIVGEASGSARTAVLESTHADGEQVVAVFPPSAVAVFADEPKGSPRNVVPVQLASVEPRGDVVRLRASARPGGPEWIDGLAADVTPAAVADLAAEPGSLLWFAVKATEVEIHTVGPVR